MKLPGPSPKSTSATSMRQVAGQAGLVVTREPRQEIQGMAISLQKTRLLLNGDGSESVPCKIVDSSESGYRLALSQPLPVEGVVEVGAKLCVELTDHSREDIIVRWLKDGELGVQRLGRQLPPGLEKKESLFSRMNKQKYGGRPGSWR